MAVPYTFGTATAAIPLSQLDSNFATAITIGNTAVQLGNTVTTLNNMTLANVTISSGTITITNVSVTTANVSGTANISTLVVVGNETVGGNTTITGNITAANANVTTNLVLSGGTANGVAYLNTSKVLTTGSALVFDGTNLGVGIASPGCKLDVLAASNTSLSPTIRVYSNNLAVNTALAYDGVVSNSQVRLYAGAASNVIFGINATEVARIDSSGNLGVGQTSMTNKLEVNGGIRIGNSATIPDYGIRGLSGTGTQITSAYKMSFYVNGSERALIDDSGNLLVGLTATSAYLDGKLDVVATGSQPAICAKLDPAGSTTQFAYSAWTPYTTGNNQFMSFETETTASIRGSITYNRAGGLVAYNTTSDYRAKDIYGSIADSGSVIDSVPVYMGKMHGATQERPMFLAHETPEYAHTGEKDAVDKDGKPVYQQMDASALIPVMWAEIQSLRKRLTALESA